MDTSNIIEPIRLTNMQEMEVHVNGPDGANRLFIYSGMAEVELCGGMPHPRWSLEVVCFELGRKYDCDNGEKVINIVATASMAGGPHRRSSQFCRLASLWLCRRTGH